MTTGLPEGTPILCRQCGGRMSLEPDASALCRYCGARDALPADELGRVLEIKGRLAIAERRSAHVRGMDAALARIFEDPKAFARAAGLYFALALVLLALSSLQLFSLASKLDGRISTRDFVSLAATQAIGPLFILAMALSIAGALARGRSHYRARLRPLLLAHPPEVPGRPYRCRACGGDLPPSRGADSRCRYCSTVNLVPRELHRERAEQLRREGERMQRSLTLANTATLSISGAMRRAFFVCLASMAVLSIGLTWLVRSLMGI